MYFLPLILPGEFRNEYFFCLLSFYIFTENNYGVDKLIRILKQKWLMLQVQVN